MGSDERFSFADEKGILKGPYANIEPIKASSITEYCLKNVGSFGKSAFLVDPKTKRTLTYEALPNEIRKFGAGLVSLGLKKGDVVCMFSPNSLEWGIVFHGVLSVGGILTTCNPIYKEKELNHQLGHSGAKILIAAHAFLDKATEAMKGRPSRP